MDYLTMFKRLLELTRQQADEQIQLEDYEVFELNALNSFFHTFMANISPALEGKK